LAVASLLSDDFLLFYIHVLDYCDFGASQID
jgi:hypothetical protein